MLPAFVVNRENHQAFSGTIKTITGAYQVKILGDYFVYYPVKTRGDSLTGLNKKSTPYYWNGTHLLKMKPSNGVRDEG